MHLEFSHSPRGLSWRTIRDRLFDVDGGQILKTRRLAGGRNQRWELTVQPIRRGALTLTAKATTNCSAQHKVCDRAVFTLARTGATDDALTVTVAVTEAGSVLDGTPATSVTFAEEAATATFSVATNDDAVDEAEAQVQAAISSGEGYQVDTRGATARADVFDNDEAEASDGVEELWSTTLTWTDIGGGWAGGYADSFAQSSWTEDGTTFRIWCIALNTSSGALFVAHDGSGGRIPDADEITLRIGDVEVARTDMQLFAEASVATMHGVGSQRSVGDEVPIRLTRASGDAASASTGPTVSVADAQVREAAGTPLRFQVTLNEAATSTVSVRYRSSDGTATAGEDYKAVYGALRFGAGETAKTVSVDVIEDAHDEGSETMTLTLSEPYGATVLDGSGVGTINNTGPMPQAWIARFGRTVAEQAIEAMEARFQAPRQGGFTGRLGGQALSGFGNTPSGADGSQEEDRAEDGLRGLETIADRLADPDDRAPEARGLTGRDMLTGSSLALTRGTAETGFASIWGRGAVTRFDGREGGEGGLSLDGEVVSAMLGADFSTDRVLAGLVLSRSRGEGGYRSAEGDASGGGTIESALTALFPYGRLAVSERVSVWGMAGVGEGTLTLTPEDGATLRPDLSFLMGAAGVRGLHLDGADGGPMLALKSDAMAVRTSTDAVSGSAGNLAAADGDVTRLRLALEGSRPFALGGGPDLRVELSGREAANDNGRPETAVGLRLNARWQDRPERGPMAGYGLAAAPGSERADAGARHAGFERGYKRPFDLFAVALLLVALLPFWLVLCAAIALAIRIEGGGPVLYRQVRLGLGGRAFRILKFRTMPEGGPDADEGPVSAAWRDARTTPVGRVLRRFHLDELPQAVNVVRGEMSLVGPRPERPELAARIEREVPGFARRLRVRPGIMGLAQARCLYDCPPRRKLQHDELYIRRMSPWLDIRLIGACTLRVLAGPGAAADRHRSARRRRAAG